MNNKRYNNAMEYMPSKWLNVFPLSHRKNTIDETFRIIKDNILTEGLFVNYQGKTLQFHCLIESDLQISWSFVDIGIDACYGRFLHEDNHIEFDSSLKKDGFKLYETLYHEYAHKLQSVLINHIDEYPQESMEYKYLLNLKHEVEHKNIDGQAFGKSFSGDSYVDPIVIKNALERDVDFAIAAYELQISERSAYSTGYKAYEYVVALCTDQEYVKKTQRK